ncbi:hypothetical protein IWZ01DRAFT_333802 [Phyllosticta capitalensis]
MKRLSVSSLCWYRSSKATDRAWVFGKPTSSQTKRPGSDRFPGDRQSDIHNLATVRFDQFTLHSRAKDISIIASAYQSKIGNQIDRAKVTSCRVLPLVCTRSRGRPQPKSAVFGDRQAPTSCSSGGVGAKTSTPPRRGKLALGASTGATQSLDIFLGTLGYEFDTIMTSVTMDNTIHGHDQHHKRLLTPNCSPRSPVCAEWSGSINST